MFINYEKKIIEMTKSEAKEAGNPGNTKFEELVKAKALFPDFAVVVKESAKKRDCYRGLDYKFMKMYIEANDNAEANMKKFYELRGMNENGEKSPTIKEHSFGEIKMWFLETYSEIEQFNDKNDKMLSDIKKARAARKAS